MTDNERAELDRLRLAEGPPFHCRSCHARDPDGPTCGHTIGWPEC